MPRDDLDSELKDLRKELADTHAMTTRTHNAVTTLAASLKEVVARQNRYDRGLNLNSFVAYLIFTILLGGGFYRLYKSSADRLVDERDRAIQARQSAIDEAAGARKELAARDEAERKALAFWQLLKDDKREEAIARYAEITHERLTPVEEQVFQEGVARARTQIVDGGYTRGVDAFQNQQWKQASQHFRRALEYEEEGPRAAQMRYYYGVALHKLGDYAAAAHQLELALAGGAERTVGPDARFYLASALEALRQLDRARAEFEKFATAHPQHHLAGTARRKAAELAARAAKAN